MKTIFSILFATLILLSGMHLSLATHLCGGEVSAVKLSFTHEKASCGMCADEQATSTKNGLSTEDCCKNEISFYAVDSNYSPKSMQINKPVNSLIQVFYIPTYIGIQTFNGSVSVNTNIQPPGKFIACAVSLPDICVFRI